MTVTVQGNNDSKFAALHDTFEKNFSDRGEVGASLCVSVNGEARYCVDYILLYQSGHGFVRAYAY